MQHVFEVIYDFLHDQTEEAVGHDGLKYLAFFGTLFFFILFGNLIGIIPGFESPTMFPAVTLGLRDGRLPVLQHRGSPGDQGSARYLEHFAGPMLVHGAADDSDRNCQSSGPAAVAHDSSLCEHAGGRKSHSGLSRTDLPGHAGRVYGIARLCLFLQAYVFAVLTMMYVGGATWLTTSTKKFCSTPAFQCEPAGVPTHGGNHLLTANLLKEKYHESETFHDRPRAVRIRSPDVRRPTAPRLSP